MWYDLGSAPSSAYFQHQLDRAVVRAHDVGMVFDVDNTVSEFRRDEEIVDAPSNVALPNAWTIGPPCVVTLFFGVALPEDVDISMVEETGDPRSFFRQETGVLLIGLGVGQVDFFVRRIDITTDDDGSSLPTLFFGVLQHGLRKGQLVGHPGEVIAAIGKVAGVKQEIAVVGDDQATFGIESFLTEAADDDALRLALGIEANARIPLLLGGVEPCCVALRLAGLRVHLFRQGSNFLEPHDVRLGLPEPIQEALASTGAEAVDVPGN